MKLGRVVRTVLGLECCDGQMAEDPGLEKVLIVGSPNVGKSLLFNRLTGRYVTVSNYPGTTVDVSRGHLKTARGRFEVIDTPGMYSLWPITDEERVACRMLLDRKAHAVVHVIDAKNIERMLGLTLQLAEAGLPLIVVLNMADEARRLGIRIDRKQLAERLGAPVVETVATTGQGVRELIEAIGKAKATGRRRVDYGEVLDGAVGQVEKVLSEQAKACTPNVISGSDSPRAHKNGLGIVIKDFPPQCGGLIKKKNEIPSWDEGLISLRTRALLLLQNDRMEMEGLTADSPLRGQIAQIAANAHSQLGHSIHYHAVLALKEDVGRALKDAVAYPADRAGTFAEKLSRLLMRPSTGVPVLLLVLYFGLYKFVGVLGAGVAVDYLQNELFTTYITPHAEQLVNAVIPWQTLRELFIGDFGIITLGIRYAIAIILPVVGAFFIAFSIIEDSGYLPRMAMLIDRLFKKIGLNGRAVIPLVLGFGCDTMATMVTRTLETRREKIIATVLLALTIPCSAQLGVILGLLEGHAWALATWAGFVGVMFVGAGLVISKVMPGEKPQFYMELPPLRLPRLGNVVVKTYTRMAWYFKEVLPLFILASIFIWIGNITGLFPLVVKGMTPLVNGIGLPGEAAGAFVFGFFRRDYGAAGLYDIQEMLSANQLVVAAITLTLFLPCVAQFLIMRKERGMKMALAMSAGIFVLAFGMGYVAHLVLTLTGAKL